MTTPTAIPAFAPSDSLPTDVAVESDAIDDNVVGDVVVGVKYVTGVDGVDGDVSVMTNVDGSSGDMVSKDVSELLVSIALRVLSILLPT